MDLITVVAMAAGLGWASGIRLYAVLFFLGLLHYTGVYALPPNLQVLAHPTVMAISGFLFFIEFFADKIPAFDTLWDALHTFIRIPGGALLAAAAVAGGDLALGIAAGLLGGTMAAGSHLTKSGSRALINTSPEPFSNWAASFSEDTLALAGLWAALKYPLVFLALLALFILCALWLLPRLWRGVKRMFATIRRLP
ncbi:MAG: DUF4126 domain-containing protein [Burkholderiales bacterium]|nr:DUF4126 domain-containing protein [Burkholderiales bacterium]